MERKKYTEKLLRYNGYYSEKIVKVCHRIFLSFCITFIIGIFIVIFKSL